MIYNHWLTDITKKLWNEDCPEKKKHEPIYAMQFEDTSLCIYGVSNRSDASLSGSKSFTNFVPPDWKLGQKVSVNGDKDDIIEWEAPLHEKQNLTNPYIENEAPENVSS